MIIGNNWTFEKAAHPVGLAEISAVQAQQVIEQCQESDWLERIPIPDHNGRLTGQELTDITLFDDNQVATDVFEYISSEAPDLLRMITDLGNPNRLPEYIIVNTLCKDGYINKHRDIYPNVVHFEALTGNALLRLKDPLTNKWWHIPTGPGDRYVFNNPYQQRMRPLHKVSVVGDSPRISIGTSTRRVEG